MNVFTLCFKRCFPYEYLDYISKQKDTQLPPKEAFSTRLGEGTIYVDSSDSIASMEISEKDYQHAQNVFQQFHCETLKDYYAKNDRG